MNKARAVLSIAGIADLCVAGLFLGIVLSGPQTYDYFGAPELGVLAAQGSVQPMMALAVVFAVFGVYAFSGASWLPRLPFTRLVIFMVASLYVLRGLLVVWEGAAVVAGVDYPTRNLLFSVAALAIGMLHLAGFVEL